LRFSLRLWRSRFICNLNMSFLCKKHISVSACYRSINKPCLDEQAKQNKMFLSAITPPICNAWCTPPPPKKKNPQILSCLNIHPANFFRLAYSRNNYGFANTYGFVNVHILTLSPTALLPPHYPTALGLIGPSKNRF
jgi:hypothetical protein